MKKEDVKLGQRYIVSKDCPESWIVGRVGTVVDRDGHNCKLRLEGTPQHWGVYAEYLVPSFDDSPKPLKLKCGKRYVQRDGEITSPISGFSRAGIPMFIDLVSGRTYIPNGRYSEAIVGILSLFDIIAEYVEPIPTQSKSTPLEQDGSIPLDWSKVKPGCVLVNGFGGKEITAIEYRGHDPHYPYAVQFKGDNSRYEAFTRAGRHVFGLSSVYDIIAMIPAPEPKKVTVKGWMNVYRYTDGQIHSSLLHETKNSADHIAGRYPYKRIACIYVERALEEGEGL